MSDSKGPAEDQKNGDEARKEVVVKAFTAVKISRRSRGENPFFLIDGQAEVAGAPLLQHTEYSVRHRHPIMVFSWKGCTLEVSSALDVEPTDYCPFNLVLKNHALFEVERQKASESGTRGPGVMVIGDHDTGKTTVVTSLLNYAVRMGRTPVFVSLDVRHGELSVPGSLGAVVVDKMSNDTGRFRDFKEPPLMYHFGHAYVRRHRSLYLSIIENLGKDVLAALERNSSVKASGFIMDTAGECKAEVIKKAAESFEVSHVIVIDDERLYNDVIRDLPPFVIVSYLPKLPGVVVRDRDDLIEVADVEIRKYFGVPTKKDRETKEKTATEVTMSFDDVTVLDVPSDDSSRRRELRCKTLGIKDGLDKHLLSISTAPSKDEAPLANIYGYAVVKQTDKTKKEIKFTIPSGTSLPGSVFLKTDGVLSDNED